MQIITPTRNQPFHITVFPNPVGESAILQFEGENINSETLLLYDLQGMLVRQEHFNENRITFNKGSLLSGMYFFEVITKSYEKSYGKLIIR